MCDQYKQLFYLLNSMCCHQLKFICFLDCAWRGGVLIGWVWLNLEFVPTNKLYLLCKFIKLELQLHLSVCVRMVFGRKNLMSKNFLQDLGMIYCVLIIYSWLCLQSLLSLLRSLVLFGFKVIRNFLLQGLLTLGGMYDSESKPLLLCSTNDNSVRIYDLPS